MNEYQDVAKATGKSMAEAGRKAVRRQAIEAAEIERRQLIEVLDMLPVYVVLLSPDYHVPFANRFFEERFGKSAGRRCFEYLFNRSEPCEDCQTYKVLKTNATHRWEWTGPDGRDYDIYDFPFTDSDGSPLIMEVGLDVTERKRAEAELARHRRHLEELVEERTSRLETANSQLQAEIAERAKAEAALRLAKEQWEWTFNSVPDLIAVIDLEHRVVRANRAMADRLGLAPEQCVGLPCHRAVHNTDSPPAFCPHSLTCADGREHSVEVHEEHLGGDFLVTTTPLRDEQGRLIGSVHVARDITESKKTEEALRRLSHFPKENPYPVLRVGADGSCMYANEPARNWLKTLGYQAGGALPEALLQVICEARRQKNAVSTEITNAAGITFACSAVQPPGEEYVNLYGNDITDRNRAQEALRKANELLEVKVAERTADLQRINKQLQEEIQDRIRTEQSLRLEETRMDALLRLSQMSEAPLDEITAFTLEQAIALTRSKIGFVGFLNEDESVYTLHAVSKDVVKECNVSGDPLQWHVVDAGIWAEAVSKRDTLFVNDYSKPHPRKKGLPPGHPYVERFMVVPIIDGNRIVALVGVGNKGSDYDKSDERQVSLLLRGMWGCMQKICSREELHKAYRELEEKVKLRTAELAASAAALEKSQKDLNRAQAVGQIGSWRLDVRKNVLTWSDENHRIFGVPKGATMNYETFLNMVHPEDRGFVDAKWKAAVRGEPYDIEHRIAVDGQVRWVREKAYMEFDKRGEMKSGFGITQDITERKKVEETLKRLNETLEAQVAERTAIAERRAWDLGRLAAELNEAEHRERKRLAKLLHDDLQQLLLAIKLRLPAIVEGDPNQLSEHFQRLDQLVGECLATSRNLAHELSPPIIQHGTLPEIIEWLGEWFSEKHGLNVDVETRGEIPPVPEYMRVFFFQAARELLINVAKHSGKMHARVTLSSRDANVTLQVEDDGNRFDPKTFERRLQRPEGFGLFHIRERLEAMQGSLEIEATPQGGGCFRIIIPLDKQN